MAKAYHETDATKRPYSGDSKRIYTPNVQFDRNERPYGLADIPLSYYPAPKMITLEPNYIPLDWNMFLVEKEDVKGRCMMQVNNPPTQPIRKLWRLANVPHAVVTAHASSHSEFDYATVAFMQQAGLSVDWLRLEKFRILGNGPLMFLETNSDKIAKLIDSFIRRKCRQIPANWGPADRTEVTPAPSSVEEEHSQAVEEDTQTDNTDTIIATNYPGESSFRLRTPPDSQMEGNQNIVPAQDPMKVDESSDSSDDATEKKDTSEDHGKDPSNNQGNNANDDNNVTTNNQADETNDKAKDEAENNETVIRNSIEVAVPALPQGGLVINDGDDDSSDKDSIPTDTDDSGSDELYEAPIATRTRRSQAAQPTEPAPTGNAEASSSSQVPTPTTAARTSVIAAMLAGNEETSVTSKYAIDENSPLVGSLSPAPQAESQWLTDVSSEEDDQNSSEANRRHLLRVAEEIDSLRDWQRVGGLTPNTARQRALEREEELRAQNREHQSRYNHNQDPYFKKLREKREKKERNRPLGEGAIPPQYMAAVQAQIDARAAANVVSGSGLTRSPEFGVSGGDDAFVDPTLGPSTGEEEADEVDLVSYHSGDEM